MKRLNSLFLIILIAALIVGPVWGQTVRQFPGPVKFGSTTTLGSGAVAYTWPAADGTNGYQLTTNGSGTLSWAAAGSGTGNTLDQAYDQGGSGAGGVVTVDAAALQLAGSHATNNTFFINKTTGSGHGLQITNAGTGYDINGTSGTWFVTKAGALTAASAALGTVTQTGNWTLGNSGANTIGINTSSWDISTAGAMSGFTSLSLSDDITMATGKGVKSSTTTAHTTGIYGYDVDGTAYVGGLVITNGDTPATVLGNANGTTAITSSDWAISTAGVMTGIGAITSDGLLTGTLGATISGATVNLNASSNFAVNIGTGTTTGTVTVGGTGTQAIDIGNGAGVKTVAFGSSNTTSTTTLLSGSGGVLVNNSNNQPTTINGGTSTGTVTIGNTTPAIVNVLGTVSVNTSAAALATNIGAGTTTGTITIGGTGAQQIDVGNGAAAKTVNVGSSNTTSTTTILSGSGGVNINASNNQPTNIGTGTTTGTVTIGGAGAQEIDIGNGAAAKTVVLGSTNTTSTTTINAGSGGIVLGGNVSGAGTKTVTGTLVVVTDDTDGEATIGAAESGSVQTNAGASGAAAWVLPGAAAGLKYTFMVMAAQELRVTPAAGDKICIAGVCGDAAEYWVADAVGESLTLIAVDTTNWVAESSLGTWTQASP